MISQYEVSLPGLKQPFANRVVALFICMTQIFSHWLVWVCERTKGRRADTLGCKWCSYN